MQTVLITGGTGLVGKALTQHLTNKGYAVIILSRNPKANSSLQSNVSFASWDVNKQLIDVEAVQKADYIIHLAGAGVMDKKWTDAYKKEIIDSRVNSANLLVETLKKNTNKVKAVISASAIGWYKENTDVHTEVEPADTTFLGHTCMLWEQSVEPFVAMGKRLVKIRIGIVLSKDGGALKEFISPLKFRVAAILGNQIISWIHIDDLCNLFVNGIENENLYGAYNAVATNPVTNKVLMHTLAKEITKGFYLPIPVPNFIIKLMLGDRSTEILKSSNVSNKKIEATGFKFEYKTIDKAIANLL
jgi:uncharacterized protein